MSPPETARRLDRPTPFADRYTLLEKLAVGGMAEIYRARREAIPGFEKDVAIKRLRPELASDPRMVEMFLDEARISALLNHPNIVHVYDVGEHEGTPFIAMELIVGEELSALCRRGLALGKFLPLPHAVDLMRQAARGMGYYHARRGEDGDSRDIVHCDISPNNLLVTEDGELKIIDFGIARSRTQLHRDQGPLPGKVSYMSPEQVSKEPLDFRSDIFALGIVLYEITVGRRLFRGRADEVVARVRDCDIEPPTFVRKDYPGALESIVMRALERHREDRFESAYDMADEMDEFLRDNGLRSGPMRVARYLDLLAEASGGARREELITEAERHADERADELDFDRGIFDGFQAAVGGSERDASEWDEVEEDEDDVAAALGVPVEQLDRSGIRSWGRERLPPLESDAAAARANQADSGAELAPDMGVDIDVDADSSPAMALPAEARLSHPSPAPVTTSGSAAARNPAWLGWVALLWALVATAVAVWAVWLRA